VAILSGLDRILRAGVDPTFGATQDTDRRSTLRLFWMALAVSLGLSGLLPSSSRADSFSNCIVTDVQYSRNVVATSPSLVVANSFIFKACGFFWEGVAGGTGNADIARDLVLAAFNTARRVNVQCGFNGSACSTKNIAVYDNNSLVSRQVFLLGGVQLRP